MLRRCSVVLCVASASVAGTLASHVIDAGATKGAQCLRVHVGPPRSEAADFAEPMLVEQPHAPASMPNPSDQHYSLRRSIYSTFRRLPGKSSGGRPGHCVRGIFANSSRKLNAHPTSGCGPLCCCSAVVSPMWATIAVNKDEDLNHTPPSLLMQDVQLQAVMDAAAAARVICINDVFHGDSHPEELKQQRLHDVAPSLSTFLSKWTRNSSTSGSHDHPVRIDGALAHLAPLCADINPSLGNGATDWVAQTLFTVEESESIYYFIVRLQDVATHSVEETNRLLTISSLKVLLAVSSIRQATKDSSVDPDHRHQAESTPHPHHPTHHPRQHHVADSSCGHAVTVLREVYETVLKTVIDSHNSSQKRNQAVPPIGLVDIAAAFAMRRASPNACVRFLCDVLRNCPMELDREFSVDVVHDLIASGSEEALKTFSLPPPPGTTETLSHVADAIAELLLMLTEDVLSVKSADGSHRSHRQGRRRVVELVRRHCEELLKFLPHSVVSSNDVEPAAVVTNGSVEANKVVSPLSRLLSCIVEWQRSAPSWMNQELSSILTQVLDGIVQASARSGGSTHVLQLLKSVGLTNVLQMERMFFVAVPILRGLQSAEDLVGDFIEHAVSDAAIMYAGTQANMLLSADSAAALDAFLRAVEKKRAALQQTPECTLAPDLEVISSILDDFALLGKHVFSSQQMQARSDDGRHHLHHLHRGADAAVDPDAALLGGPVEFARYLLNTVKQVWSDIQSIRPTDEDGSDDSDFQRNARSHADNTTTAAPVTPITVAPSVVRDFTLLLERVVVLSMSVLRHQVPLVSPALSKIIDTSLQLPNLHDEYRRKLFLMVNVDSGRHTGGDAKEGATGHDTPEALLKLTAALPLQFLPWSSTQITKEVLASSHGHGPRYLHLLRTAVDLQLPPSTARSRIAGVLEVYKLVRSQRDKLPPLEYTRLLLRCLMSLPLSYIFSSWTFFLWWTFVGFLVALHITGWSWEAFYVVKARRLEFAKPLTGGVGLAERKYGSPVQQPSSVVEYVMTHANTLVAHPVANTVMLVVHDVAATPTTGLASPLQFRLAEAACRSLNTNTTTPFVLRYPPAVGGGTAEYLVVDDILRDCAQRIRREANTTWNPFQRLIFNLFPLFRPTAEESLIKLITHRAASKGVPCTFMLMIPDHVYLTEASLQRMRDVFARQYVSNLVIIVNHTNPSIASVSNRMEVVASRGDAELVLDAAAVCQCEGEDERWNIAAVSNSLGAALFATPDGYRISHSEPTSAIGLGIGEHEEVTFVSPMWKNGIFTSLLRPKPVASTIEPPSATRQEMMMIALRRTAQTSIPSIFNCRRVTAQSIEALLPLLRNYHADAASALAESQFVQHVHSLLGLRARKEGVEGGILH
ncbi:Hypothetical protein, putative [Bodo saltans]|uniref:Transmembrane protein n=1 Tax=Bodo saltans TaxID=75058 RepID=A0A0S4IS72_BODSA|nr:Hypothetical protein, putative [Bodo saltans]|eukprot:CUF61525.1 Hypothetical protein, putative [Bodo saltans]